MLPWPPLLFALRGRPWAQGEPFSLFPTRGIILKNEVKRGRRKSGARSILAAWKKKILVQRARQQRVLIRLWECQSFQKTSLGVADSPSMKKPPPASPLRSFSGATFLYRTRCMPAKFVCETNGISPQQLRSVNSRSFAWLISIGEK